MGKGQEQQLLARLRVFKRHATRRAMRLVGDHSADVPGSQFAVAKRKESAKRIRQKAANTEIHDVLQWARHPRNLVCPRHRNDPFLAKIGTARTLHPPGMTVSKRDTCP